MPILTDFRFDQWVARVKQFTESLSHRVLGEVESQVTVEPPLDSVACNALIREIGHPTPASLQSFLTSGSAGLEFSYLWTATGSQADAIKSIYKVKDYARGGGALCKAADFQEWLRDCKEWAEGTWVAEYPEDLAFWTQSFPILRMDTSDFLGLDCRNAADDPAVAYLSHDDESKVIAPSFTAFLIEWERLRYIGPDIGMLEQYFDENGMLSADTEKGKVLRGAFGDVG